MAIPNNNNNSDFVEARETHVLLGDVRSRVDDCVKLLTQVLNGATTDQEPNGDSAIGAQMLINAQRLEQRLADQRRLIDNKRQALNEVMNQAPAVGQTGDDRDLVAEYQQRLVALEKSGANVVDRSRDATFSAFRAAVDHLLSNTDDNVMAPRTNIGDGNPTTVRIDDDVELTQITRSHKDPITRKDITQPVKNRHCLHVYDRASIDAYIRASAGRNVVLCPVGACSNVIPVVLSDLDDFPEFFNL